MVQFCFLIASASLYIFISLATIEIHIIERYIVIPTILLVFVVFDSSYPSFAYLFIL
jgi:hypothetical protein